MAEQVFESDRRERLMGDCVHEVSAAMKVLGHPDPWGPDVKASDEFLNPLFNSFFQKLDVPNLLRKTDYHVLAGLLSKDQIPPEVVAKLDGIASVASNAKGLEAQSHPIPVTHVIQGRLPAEHRRLTKESEAWEWVFSHRSESFHSSAINSSAPFFFGKGI